MIRAAVLLTHAALEDLLGNFGEILLPKASAKVLRVIPLIDATTETRTKHDLGDLTTDRGQTVSEVIRRSVVAHLSHATYNNVDQIARALNQMGLPRNLLDGHGSNLAALITRRHHIAHRADRYEGEGISHGFCRVIDLTTVSIWIKSVQDFGRSVTQAIAPDLVTEGDSS